MKCLGREELLAKEVLDVEMVQLSADECVYVRMMNGKEREVFERSTLREEKDAKGNITYKPNMEDFRTKLIASCVCDPDGNNILKIEDAVLLNKNRSAKTIEKIVEVAQRLNKITSNDQEEAIKNSEAAQTEEGSSESGGKSEGTPIPTAG